MLLITRFDYSRLREWKLGIYGVPDRRDPARVRAGRRRPAGRSARSRCRSSASSRPSSARCCWSCRWRASWSTGSGGWTTARRPAGWSCSRVIPAMLVIGQPDLGSGLVYLAIARRDPVRRGHAVDALRGAGRARGGGDRGRADRGARGGRRGAQAVPEGPAHGLPQPGREPARGGLPDQPVADGDRLRGEDRPRRRSNTDEARLPARAPHGLRVLGGGRGVRLRGRGAGSFAVRPADLASIAYPYDVRRTSTEHLSQGASPRC